MIFASKTPWEKEWEYWEKKEEKYLKRESARTEPIWNQKLSSKVPQSLQSTLENAFEKAFSLIFQKGTGIIEKTYSKQQVHQDAKVRQYAVSLNRDKRSFRAFSKQAGSRAVKNTAISGVEGIGLGLLGVGIPDIPLFAGMILKSLYELAVSYGYSYETDEERKFLLLLMEASIGSGEQLHSANDQLNHWIFHREWLHPMPLEEQIRCTAQSLARELLYLKFLQGIPLVGAVGGIYDAVYLKKIQEFAKLKYQRRFLWEQRRSFEHKNTENG